MTQDHPPVVQQASMTTREFIKTALIFQLSLAAVGIYLGLQHDFHAPSQS